MVTLLLRKFAPPSLDNAQRRMRYGYICGGAGIFLNLILFAIKFIIGIISGSVSISADAFNNLSDAFSSGVTLGGFFLAGRYADEEHPFGHGRIEYLSGIIISFLIVIVGVELFKSSAEKIMHPTNTVFNKYVVMVLVISILIKLYMAIYNSRCGKEINSKTLSAASSDSLSDIIVTSAVLASAVVMHFTHWHIDGWVGCVVSCLIIKAGITAVIETAGPLLGNPPDEDFVKSISDIVCSCPETVGIHDLVVHDYGQAKRFVSLHMEVDGSKDLYMLHDAVDNVEREISQKLNCEAVIHMDPIDVHNPVVKRIHEKLTALARSVGDGVDVHDIRIVPGNTHTNIIFDLILPPHLAKDKNDITAKFIDAVQEEDGHYYAVIKVEQSYL